MMACAPCLATTQLHSSTRAVGNLSRPSLIVPGHAPGSSGKTNHGMYVAVVAFLSTGLSVGMTNYAFGAFVEPLETEFGWSRAQINVALSFAFVSGIISPGVGWLMDRHGARPVMAVSIAIMATGFLLRPLIGELWHFYLFSAMANLGMPGATVMPAGRLVGLWFPRTRGRMMGIVTSGNNFGGLTITPFATLIIAAAGWRWGFASMGLILVVLVFVILLVVKENVPVRARTRSKTPAGTNGSETASVARGTDGISSKDALRRRSFYLITAGFMGGGFTYTVILTQLIPHFRNVGWGETTPALALSTMAGFGIAGKLMFGFLSEKITARRAFILSLWVQAVGLTGITVAGSSQLAWGAIPIFGVGFGGMGALIPLTLGETFGFRSFGAIMGLVSFVSLLPQVTAPVIAGMVFDATESYTLVFSFIVAMYLLGAAALFAVKPAPAAD